SVAWFLLDVGTPPTAAFLSPYTTLFRSRRRRAAVRTVGPRADPLRDVAARDPVPSQDAVRIPAAARPAAPPARGRLVARGAPDRDRKSTRLNSSHVKSSYAVFCLRKENK